MSQLKRARINDVFASDGYIRADGRMVHDMYLMQVKKPSESTEPWDYYHVKKVIPGKDAFQPLSESRCSLLKKS
jgi:branched-chain amino acid transport system substrate-binding protein